MAHGILAGPLIVNDGVFMMYYSGWSDSHDAWKIGLATSTVGINRTKEAQPILSGNGWDCQMVILFKNMATDR